MNPNDQQPFGTASASANPAGTEVGNGLNPGAPSNAAGHLREQAEHAWETTRERAESALHSGEDYVRENPIPVVLGALALGFVLGLACGHQREPETWRERYVEEPLDRTHGALLGVLLALAAAGRKLLGSATECTRDTADEVRRRTKPLAKAAKRAGKKLHIG